MFLVLIVVLVGHAEESLVEMLERALFPEREVEMPENVARAVDDDEPFPRELSYEKLMRMIGRETEKGKSARWTNSHDCNSSSKNCANAGWWSKCENIYGNYDPWFGACCEWKGDNAFGGGKIACRPKCSNKPTGRTGQAGCAGTKWSDGSPAWSICANNNGNYPWHEECCNWVNGACEDKDKTPSWCTILPREDYYKTRFSYDRCKEDTLTAGPSKSEQYTIRPCTGGVHATWHCPTKGCCRQFMRKFGNQGTENYKEKVRENLMIDKFGEHGDSTIESNCDEICPYNGFATLNGGQDKFYWKCGNSWERARIKGADWIVARWKSHLFAEYDQRRVIEWAGYKCS